MSKEKNMLYINTLKYLKPTQFYYRGFFLVKRKVVFKTKYWQKNFENKLEKNLVQTKQINLVNMSISKKKTNNYSDVLSKRNSINNQEFHFLNKTIVFKKKLGWHDSSISQLWRYNLHYFNYFRELIECETLLPSNDNYLLLKRYVKSWIDNNSNVGQGDGWHPYTISLRLVNWILTYSAFNNYIERDEEFKTYFLKSIIAQNQFLLKNLEYDVVGNHLFENLKALIIFGIFSETSNLGKRSRKIGEKELVKQLNEQFHSDGGHFELSAMYHSILLKGLTELTYLYKNFGFNIPKEFVELQNKAYSYLENIIHPDGEIPLFNDAAFDIADSPKYLFEYALTTNNENLSLLDLIIKSNGQDNIKEIFTSKETVFYAKETGYLKTEDQEMFSIIDVGKPCPNYLPAHAHADIFSYELSFKGKRLVVDTGTYEYAGPKREHDRSTQAHNTLTINKENQSQVWGNFRVADRGFPTVHHFEENTASTEIIASHDGYNKKYGATHTRKYIHFFSELILVMDQVNTIEKLESYIHFHPNVELNFNKDKVFINGENIVLKPINAIFSIENAVYHPKFGCERRIKKVVVSPLENKPFGYYFHYGNRDVSLLKDKLLISGSELMHIDLRME